MFYVSRDCHQISPLLSEVLKRIKQQLIFRLKITGFSNDFWKKKKFTINIRSEIPPGKKNVFSKSTIETPEETVNYEICSKFIRTALKHIRTSQLTLGVQSGTLNMYFQARLYFDVLRLYFQIKNLYVSFFF